MPSGCSPPSISRLSSAMRSELTPSNETTRASAIAALSFPSPVGASLRLGCELGQRDDCAPVAERGGDAEQRLDARDREAGAVDAARQPEIEIGAFQSRVVDVGERGGRRLGGLCG